MPTMVSRGSRGAGSGRRAMNEINMVPFIDVMLVLLIIFMVTAPLIAPSVIDLPKVGKAASAPPSVIQLTVGKDETISIKPMNQGGNAAEQRVPLAGVGAAVKRLQPAAKPGEQIAPVVIAADKAVRYELVVQVMDKLQRAGVQRVGLSVQQQP